MIPKIVHQTTKNGLLDYYEQKLMLKNKQTLKGWNFKLWNDEDNSKLVNKYLPEFVNIYESINKGVAKSDIARCIYMYAYGGAYFDTDYEFLKTIPNALLHEKCILPVAKMVNGNIYLGNCILFSEPNHIFWFEYVKHVFQNLEISSLEEERVIEVTGPGGITNFYLNNREKFSDIFFPQQQVFHPKVVNHGFRVLSSEKTLGIHYCWGSWRSKKTYRILISKLIRNLQIFGLILK